MVSEEIVIFKLYYEYDNKKPEELSLEEMVEHMSLYQRLFYQKAKNSAEYQEARWQSKRKHLLKKKQQQEEWRRAKEGTSEEQPKDMRKYN